MWKGSRISGRERALEQSGQKPDAAGQGIPQLDHRIGENVRVWLARSGRAEPGDDRRTHTTLLPSAYPGPPTRPVPPSSQPPPLTTPSLAGMTSLQRSASRSRRLSNLRRPERKPFSGTITIVASLTLLLALAVPTSARWAGDAGSAMGVNTGTVSVDVEGDFNFSIPACDKESGQGAEKGGDRCERSSSQAVDITNTGSVPIRLSFAIEADACDADGVSWRLRRGDSGKRFERHELQGFHLCEGRSSSIAIIDQLDPGATIALELTISAERAHCRTSTSITGNAIFSAVQWNMDTGWTSTEVFEFAVYLGNVEGQDESLDDPSSDRPEPQDTPIDDEAEAPGEPDPDDEAGEPEDTEVDEPAPPSDEPTVPPATDPPIDQPPNTSVEPESISHNEISGVAWLDDGDGFRETGQGAVGSDGEPGLPDVIVALHDSETNLITETTTDREGRYQFVELPAGTYLVRFDAPANHHFADSSTGQNLISDSDVAWVQIDESQDRVTMWGWTPEIALAGTEDTATADAGLVRSDVGSDEPTDDNAQSGDLALLGLVWFDGGDGTRSETLDPASDGHTESSGSEDRAAQDVVVELYDSNERLEARSVTGPDGVYGFFDLDPGQYRVRVTAPLGFEFVKAHVGTDPTHDSDIAAIEVVEDRIEGWILVTLIDHDSSDASDVGLIALPVDGEGVATEPDTDAGTVTE